MRLQSLIKNSPEKKLFAVVHYPGMHDAYLTPEFTGEMKEKYYYEKKMPKPRNIVVLGIDLQNHFLMDGFKAHLPGAAEFIKNITDFYQLAKKRYVPIILTRHCHENDIMERWWHDAMRCDDPATEIYAKIKKFGDLVIEKRTYDTFYNTNLEHLLKKMNVKTVIITGVMTHLCCETTARSAFVRGFNVIFPIDGTLTKNAEFHEGTLRSLSHGFASTPTLKEVRRWMNSLE